MTNNDDEKIVSDDAKNGLVTANGVILAFVLGFFVNYTSADHPWRIEDILPMGTIVLGLVLLSLSIYRTFIPYTQKVPYFERTVRIMMSGILLSIIGAILGIFL
jgi:hypothetical protein